MIDIDPKIQPTFVRWCWVHESIARRGADRCHEAAYQFVRADRPLRKRPRLELPAPCRFVVGRLFLEAGE